MIHIVYGTSNLYAKFAGTSMLSVFENTTADVTVHIYHESTLTSENRDNLIYIAGRYGQTVKFYNVDAILAEDIARLKSRLPKDFLERFTVLSGGRIFVSKIIPNDIDKVILMDSDTIVNMDIAEFWRIELGDKPLAASRENEENPRINMYYALCREGLVKLEDYFNAGVMLVNLSQMRSNLDIIWGGVDFITSHPQYLYGDQEILNYCFSEKYLKISSKFNCWVRRERRLGITKIERKLYHFIGQSNSMGIDARDVFHRLYWKYFAKTPWFNAETVLNIGTGVRQLYIERQNLLVRVSAMMSGRTRAFFTDSSSVSAVRQIFAVHDGEEILTLVSNESVQQLAKSMNESRGRKVFFILIAHEEIYKQLRDMLTQVGFAEWRDFVNAKDFLSEAQGVPFDAWSIIENM